MSIFQQFATLCFNGPQNDDPNFDYYNCVYKPATASPDIKIIILASVAGLLIIAVVASLLYKLLSKKKKRQNKKIS